MSGDVRGDPEIELKTHCEPFEALWNGDKTFEFRVNDRPYRVGAVLDLREWDPVDEWYTGRDIIAHVTYIVYGPKFGIPATHCCMSLRVTRRSNRHRTSPPNIAPKEPK